MLKNCVTVRGYAKIVSRIPPSKAIQNWEIHVSNWRERPRTIAQDRDRRDQKHDQGS